MSPTKKYLIRTIKLNPYILHGLVIRLLRFSVLPIIFTHDDVIIASEGLLPLLGTRGHSPLRVDWRVTPTVTWGIRLYKVISGNS